MFSGPAHNNYCSKTNTVFNENFEFEIIKKEKEKLEKQLLETIVKMHELESEFALSTSEREKLSMELNNIKSFRNDKSDFHKENQEFRVQIDFLSNENNELNKHNRNLGEEVDNLRRKLKSMENNYIQEINEKERQINSLKSTITDLKKYVFQVEEANKNLSSMKKSNYESQDKANEKIIESLKNTVKSLECQISTLKIKENQYISEIASYKEDLKASEQIGFDEISSITSQYKHDLEENLIKAKEEFRKEIKRRDKDLDSICKENEELLSEMREIKEENQELKRQLKAVSLMQKENYSDNSNCSSSNLKKQIRNLELSHKEHIAKLREIHKTEKEEILKKSKVHSNSNSDDQAKFLLLLVEVERLHTIINELEHETTFLSTHEDLNKSKDLIIMDLTKKVKYLEKELERANSVLMDRCEGIYREMY